MTEKNTTYIQGPETAKMSNLITNMTIAGAPTEELERAVKHSLVTMDYEKSAKDNNVAELFEKYPSISYSRYTRDARRMAVNDRFTVAEISETLGLPEETIKAMLKD